MPWQWWGTWSSDVNALVVGASYTIRDGFGNPYPLTANATQTRLEYTGKRRYTTQGITYHLFRHRRSLSISLYLEEPLFTQQGWTYHLVMDLEPDLEVE